MIQYIKQAARLFWQHLRHGDTVSMELFPGVLFVITGGWMLLPGISLLFRRASLEQLNENYIGLFMLLMGVMKIHFSLFNQRKLRKITTMVGFLTWTFLATNEFLIWPTPFYGMIFLVLALNSVWLYIRLGVLYDLDSSDPKRISVTGGDVSPTGR